ncbi:MAG: hypothetical protein HRT74_08710 [Flavobacteriales bacterium]|nr:hypothetical protein [Flavobacteriales bacterium]
MDNGEPPYENVAEEMREAAIKEAKGKKYAEIMAAGGTLEEVATAVEGEVKNARAIGIKSTVISGSGVSAQEPEVVGRAIGLGVDRMSTPIIGEGGVWVIAKTDSPKEAAEKDDFFTEQDNLMKRITGAASARLFNAMKDAAQIEDNRDD